MAFINCDFKSQVLGMAMNTKVIIPNEHTSAGTKKVLYLLHGRSDDNSAWSRYTSIERYANEADMVVVMPTAHKSFYANTIYGDAFYDFIAYETPKIAQNLFGLSDLREKNYIAGLSMGGYGAFKIALTNPDKFAACASLSGVLDIEYFLKNHIGENYIFSKTEADDTNCVLKILENKVCGGVDLPYLYQCCGTEDFLYQSNLKFKALAQSLNVRHTYWESEGTHNWEYWDNNIKKVIEYFK